MREVREVRDLREPRERVKMSFRPKYQNREFRGTRTLLGHARHCGTVHLHKLAASPKFNPGKAKVQESA